ncbi:MAG: hypothetical protein KC501_40710, partial [Myxococcales bacterium]|nr:hypothetical protein [Myxococcales bacterium]
MATPKAARPADFDPAAARARVAEALANVGDDPHLIGFEAVGIQELIAANGRPLAMKGASRLVRDFDDTNLNR